MQVSEHYRLNRPQPTLDFVDVDISGDLAVFVDPKSLHLLPSEWGSECVYLVQSFFQTVMQNIRDGNDEKAQVLLGSLHEPNETHLGLSSGRAQGRALGPGSAETLWESLRQSEAARTGLLEDLEDTILMVEGISVDRVSDILINIIRSPLIEYSQAMCSLYSIPLSPGVDSGPLWNPRTKAWYHAFVDLPVTPQGKLILVPKSIVRRKMTYDLGEYYNNYILAELQAEELKKPNSDLVELLKNGNRRVTKRALKEKYGQSNKALGIRETLRNPDLLRRYRAQKKNQYHPPLDHYDLARAEGSTTPDWDGLRQQITVIPRGKKDASRYEDAVEQLLSAFMYPWLTFPEVQHEIHEGRKRIDITYTNVACDGFFGWLSRHYPAMHVFVECKNYGNEVGNPELDQLSGRFSPSRGKFGLLVCRSFEDKELFTQRCVDTAHDDRGFVIPLDDNDLIQLVELRKGLSVEPIDKFFKERFNRLIM